MSDITEGMILGIKPFFIINGLIGISSVYFLWGMNWFLALHTGFIYLNFTLLGLFLSGTIIDKLKRLGKLL